MKRIIIVTAIGTIIGTLVFGYMFGFTLKLVIPALFFIFAFFTSGIIFRDIEKSRSFPRPEGWDKKLEK